MDIVPYNSLDGFYKSKFGALRSGESVKLRIVVARSFMANGASFEIRDDSQGDFKSFPMYWAGMYSDDSEIWDLEFTAPEGITFAQPAPLEIVVKGIDRQLVGQVAASIKAIKPVEPYHNYGFHYKNETVVKKVGKRATK